MLITRSIYAVMLATIFWLAQPSVYAQEAPSPSVTIAAVDAQQSPTIQVSIYGENLPEEISNLPVALLEDGTEQEIVSDETVNVPAQLAILIDPENLHQLEASGQSRYIELAIAIFELIDKAAFVRNVDSLAMYAAAPNGQLHVIQDWTAEPNLVFNSAVQNPPEATTTSEISTDTLRSLIDLFGEPDSASQSTHSVLLFAAGVPNLNIEQASTQARAHAIQIHTVALPNAGQENPQQNPLRALADQTGGVYLSLEGPDSVAPLLQRFTGQRLQRTLAFDSTATAAKNIAVRLTLPGGQSITDTIELSSTLAVDEPPPTLMPVPIAALTPAPDVATEPQATSARIVIPGTSLTVPRRAVQVVLLLLILVLAFLVYAEIRSRRGQGEREPHTTRGKDADLDLRSTPIDPMYQLGPAQRSQRKRAGSAPTEDGLQVLAAEQTLRDSAVSSQNEIDYDEIDYDEIAYDAIDYEDEITTPLSVIGDDDATYRLPERVEQPLVGHLVRVTSDPQLPKELPIYGLGSAQSEGRQIHIGRHSKHNTVVINDKNISREHAIIVQKGGRLYLRDNASTAGTFLNWRRLHPGEELLLRHNDVISFGDIVYEFRAKGEDEATVAAE